MRIGLGNFRESDFAFVELLFQGFDGVIGVDIDRVIHLHLQDQVSSAPKIESEMNVIGHGREEALAGETLRNAEYPEKEDEQNSDDERQFPEKILIHDENRVQLSRYVTTSLLLLPPPL